MTVDRTKLKAAARRELRELTLVVVYLWLVLTSFVIERAVILSQHELSVASFGFAAINALALGKVMLIAMDLHFAQGWGKRSLIMAILAESAAFAVLLMVFKVIEDTGVNLYRGKTLVESLPDLGGHPAAEMAALSLVMFLALIPFFAFMELRDALGLERLHEIFSRPRGSERRDAGP